MPRQSLSRHLPLVMAAVLVALLAVLATLQYRWIGQVSAMQRHRLQSGLLHSGSRFAEDFDREVTRAWLYFHPGPGDVGDGRERAVRQYARWLAEAPRPQLVREVFYLRPRREGSFDAEVLRPGAPAFVPVAWPADLEPVRRRLARADRERVGPVVAEVPALLVPISIHRLPDLLALEGRDLAAGEGVPGEHLVLRLDAQVIAGEILPALTRRHFGEPGERDYSLAVVAADHPGRVIFQSDPGAARAARRSADASLPIFGLRPLDELHSLWRDREIVAAAPHGHGLQGHGLHVLGLSGPPGGDPHGGRGAWRLVLLRKDGTLEQAVARLRHHNLGISAGVLALLAAAAGLMVVTTRRAQELARRQIELVAGATHELHTPITAIRSAGQNLADGVVADPAQVRRYGALVEREGRRLSQMVGLMLELAGLESGRATYAAQPTPVAAVLDGALEDCRWLLEERQARVEKDVDPALPAVLGDAGALRRALRNLIENAAKYGGRAPWIGVHARAAGREVEVTVEDRGPGIRREDLPHLFEPFYRGREVQAGGVPGSGLGLSVVRRIVEAHRGRVSVAAGGAGRGSAFTLHLPAAPEEPA